MNETSNTLRHQLTDLDMPLGQYLLEVTNGHAGASFFMLAPNNDIIFNFVIKNSDIMPVVDALADVGLADLNLATQEFNAMRKLAEEKGEEEA